MISTLEEAKMRIKELEKENEELKAEVERLVINYRKNIFKTRKK